DYSSKFLSEFCVQKIRGEGGFGCVFEAINNIDRGGYAVKRVAVDEIHIEKALREVRAMAKLDHCGIVRYHSTWIERPPEGWQHDSDVEMLKKIQSAKRRLDAFSLQMNYSDKSTFIYIQMQLCNFSLADWLNNNRDPSSRHIPRMRSWFKQMVAVVDYIHDKNIIHRDLKPSNVLFADKDVLKLCDLGIATERKDDERSRTTFTRTRIGTELYMSPEQLSRRPYSSKTDVFSLGLILVELCIAVSTAQRREMFDKFRQGMQTDAIEDSRTAEFVRKLTQAEPNSRPSCREMLDDFFLA
ncbi:hypothetical protein PENTCL1PPCAC_4817, partial [Pristionchus entomophagus]